MFNDQRASTSHGRETYDDDNEEIREIHALTITPPQRRSDTQTHSHQSSLVSTANTEVASSENNNLTSMSRELSALFVDHNNIVSPMMNISNTGNERENNNLNNLLRIREDHELMEENNPLAIVADNNPLEPFPSASRHAATTISGQSEVTLQRVMKEEVEAKISAWQNAKVAKVNNRFKREDSVINGWENEQVHKANSWMKKIERKLEEKRVKAVEKMQNEVAKAHRKAEEKRASAEAKRGTKVARVLEIANLMRAIGRAPSKKRYFF